MVAVVVAAALAACASPEASRQRGQVGADVGNRPVEIEMHGGSDPGYQTPPTGKAADAHAVLGTGAATR